MDAHVGKHIFDKVIGNEGMLKDKTRIFVTHSVSFLSQMDEILVIKDGKIAERGSYQDLQDAKGPFSEYLKEYLQDDTEDVENEKSTDEADDDEASAEQSPEKKRERKSSQKRERNNSSGVRDRTKSKTEDDLKQKQYETEKMETGKVSLAVYIYYIKNMGLMLFGSCVFFFTAYQVFSTASSVWLSVWSDEENSSTNYTSCSNPNVTINNIKDDQETEETDAADMEQQNKTLNAVAGARLGNLGIYGLFGLGQALTAVFASVLLYLSTVQGAKTLHSNMLKNILRSPLSFFDTTPQGRILNRFGKDVDVLDTTMPMIFRGWLTCLLGVLSTFLVISYTTPIFLVPVSVIMGCYYVVQRIYVNTSRQLKRLESVSKSPIYSHFGETITGTSTIRAFRMEEDFIKQSENLVDSNQKANFPALVANRWLAVRLETVGNLIIFCSALLAVLGKDTLSPGLVGLSVSYALSVTQTLNWLVRMASEVETNIVAAERLKEYSETKQEAKWTLDNDDRHENWPSKAAIQLKDVSARYREGLPLVLKDLTFTIDSQQKVGIVGKNSYLIMFCIECK